MAMKEYNWREERKKYQTSCNRDEAPVQEPVQPQAPQLQVNVQEQQIRSTVSAGGNNRNMLILVILLIIAAIVIVALIFKSGEKPASVPPTGPNPPVVGPAEKPDMPLPPPGDTDAMLLKQAEKHKYAVGHVALQLKLKEGMSFSAPCGTAWAFAPDKFATNAHVAYALRNECLPYLIVQAAQYYIATQAEISPQEVDVLLSGMDKQLAVEVLSKAVAWVNQNIASIEPVIFINASAGQSYSVTHIATHRNYQRVGSGNHPDVAVLTIDGNHQHYFKVAGDKKLYDLKPGHRVAYLGYPTEGLVNVNNDDPIATMQSGIISAVTDFALKDSKAQANQFIRHNLPCTGGASGSPIFDRDGEVVALLFGGNMVTYVKTELGTIERIPSAVQINMAVRADVLKGVGKAVRASDFLK